MLLTIGFLLSWWAQCLRFLKISVSTLFFFFPDQRCCQHFIAIIILESPALYLSYTLINCICHHHHFCNCAPRLHGSTERPRVLDPKLVAHLSPNVECLFPLSYVYTKLTSTSPIFT